MGQENLKDGPYHYQSLSLQLFPGARIQNQAAKALHCLPTTGTHKSLPNDYASVISGTKMQPGTERQDQMKKCGIASLEMMKWKI